MTTETTGLSVSTEPSTSKPRFGVDQLRESALGRRRLGASFGAGTVAAMLAVGSWAMATGPRVYRASSDYDLWDRYLRGAQELLLAALAIWLVVMGLTTLSWHRLLARRSPGRGITTQLTLPADRYVVLPGLVIGGLLASRVDLSDLVPVAVVLSVSSRELLLSPAGAAAELIVIGWIVSYLVILLLEAAQEFERRNHSRRATA